MDERALKAEKQLMGLLGPKMSQLQDILDDINDDPGKRYYQIEIPDADTVETVSIDEMASLVARTSNAYGRLAEFTGKAEAEYKLAKGKYERKYKQHRSTGSNTEERQANAMQACEEEHLAMTVADSVRTFAEHVLTAARIASESARKIYDKRVEMYSAYNREEHGSYQDKDFN